MTPAKFALLAALGPVTGPLALLAAHLAARRRYGLSGLCIAAVGAFWIAGPMALAWLAAYDLRGISR